MSEPTTRARFLLLQVRDDDDPMAAHEVDCFVRTLGVEHSQVACETLLREPLEASTLRDYDALLLGGSGDYSAAAEAGWLEGALESLRHVHASGVPTFASCWGFQAMARAMGGEVLHDPERGEVGTYELSVTEAGEEDPLFAPLAPRFDAQIGHEDRVSVLPPNTVLLASSAAVENHAYRFEDAPIYCTQFHPELAAADLLLRLKKYPHYVRRLTGLPIDEFARGLRASVASEGILRRFVERYLADL